MEQDYANEAAAALARVKALLEEGGWVDFEHKAAKVRLRCMAFLFSRDGTLGHHGPAQDVARQEC